MDLINILQRIPMLPGVIRKGLSASKKLLQAWYNGIDKRMSETYEAQGHIIEEISAKEKKVMEAVRADLVKNWQAGTITFKEYIDRMYAYGLMTREAWEAQYKAKGYIIEAATYTKPTLTEAEEKYKQMKAAQTQTPIINYNDNGTYNLSGVTLDEIKAFILEREQATLDMIERLKEPGV